MKYSFTVSILMFIIFSCQKTERMQLDNGYTIAGNIEKSLNGKNVVLKTRESGVLTIINSTLIENGTFKFKGKVNKPLVFGIFIDSLKGAIGLFMENANISIEVNINDLSSSIIMGSKTNDKYLEFVTKSNKIISEMNILFPEFQKARAENDAGKLEEINNKMQAINDKNTAFILSYARQNPNSYVSAVALQSIIRIPSIPKDTLANIYGKFSDYVKMGHYSKEIEVYLETPDDIDSIQN